MFVQDHAVSDSSQKLVIQLLTETGHLSLLVDIAMVTGSCLIVVFSICVYVTLEL